MKTMLAFLIFFGLLSAQEIGTGLSFLKLGVGARSAAMGEAYTAVSSDHSSLHYNPASLRFAKNNEVMLMHKHWIAETSTEYLGATVVGENFSYGFSALTTSVADIEVRTKPGPSEGMFSARNFAMGLTASYSIDRRIAVGITGKMLYEKIFIDEASGYGFDFGSYYHFSDDMSFGVSILNLGAMTPLRNESSPLPTTLRLGVLYQNTPLEHILLTGAVDVVQTLADQNTHFHIGAAGVYDNILTLRAGYKTGYEFSSLSAGFGVMYGMTTFDYAFVPFTGGFNSTHTFSLSFLL
jgi:hypothetical protein